MITNANNQIISFGLDHNNKLSTKSKFGENTVEYQYYQDSACTELLDSAPIKPGTYYIKA